MRKLKRELSAFVLVERRHDAIDRAVTPPDSTFAQQIARVDQFPEQSLRIVDFFAEALCERRRADPAEALIVCILCERDQEQLFCAALRARPGSFTCD